MDGQMPPNMAAMGQQPASRQANPAPQQPEGDMAAGAKRCMEAIGDALYRNKQTSGAFTQMLSPDQKVGSAAKATIMLVTELDKKMQVDKKLLAAMTVMAAGEIMELGEAAHKMTFSQKEKQQVLMTAFEGILHAYQVNPQEAANFVGAVGPEAEQRAIKDYESALQG